MGGCEEERRCAWLSRGGGERWRWVYTGLVRAHTVDSVRLGDLGFFANCRINLLFFFVYRFVNNALSNLFIYVFIGYFNTRVSLEDLSAAAILFLEGGAEGSGAMVHRFRVSG